MLGQLGGAGASWVALACAGRCWLAGVVYGVGKWGKGSKSGYVCKSGKRGWVCQSLLCVESWALSAPLPYLVPLLQRLPPQSTGPEGVLNEVIFAEEQEWGIIIRKSAAGGNVAEAVCMKAPQENMK